MAKKQFWSQLTERATKEAILVKIIREVAKKAILVTIIREGGKKAMLVTIIREGGAILGAEQIVNHHRFPPAPGPTELRKARKNRQVPRLTCFWSSRNKWVMDSG